MLESNGEEAEWEEWTEKIGAGAGEGREFSIDNLIHFIIVMMRWTSLAPWDFEFPFPDSLTSTFL